MRRRRSRFPRASSTCAGEPPLETAKRELAEEIGKQAGDWDELFAFCTSPGFSDERVWLYLATELSDADGGAAPDEDERIEIVPWPLLAPRRRDRRLRGLKDADRAAVAAFAPRPAAVTRPSAGQGEAWQQRRVGQERGVRPANRSPWLTTEAVPSRRVSELTLDFLAYLELERGLSRNTLEAYRSDLQQFGRVPRPPRRRSARRLDRATWRRSSASSPTGHGRQGRGGAGDAAAQDRLPALVLPPPAPRGAARRRPDVAAAPTAPARTPAEGAQPRRGQPAARPADRAAAPAALRDRALLETMYACGLRASEAIGLDPRDLDLEAGVLVARGKGSKERIVPIGSKAIETLRAYLDSGRPAPGRARRRAARVRQPARRGLSRQGLYKIVQRHARDRRPRAADEPAHAAAHVRDPPARRRLRPALAPGDARPRRHRHDADLHAPVGRPPARRVLRRPPARPDRTRQHVGSCTVGPGDGHHALRRGARARYGTSGTSAAAGRSSARRPARSGSASGGSRSRRAAGRRRCTITGARRRSSMCSAAPGSRGTAAPRRRCARGTASSSAALRGGHTLHAVGGELDVLAFGPREYDEGPAFPRLGVSFAGNRFTASEPLSIDGVPIQFVREAAIGPPELPAEPGPRPATIVNARRRRASGRRAAADRSRAAQPRGRRRLDHDRPPARRGRSGQAVRAAALPLARGGAVRRSSAATASLLLDGDEHPVRPGHVVSRPAGTGVAHAFRAGPEGLTVLAYGTREPGDICYYPTSNKINFGGVRLIARIERLDYWDGED